MKSDTLSLNTIINELDCLKKAVFFQWSVKKKKKKDLVLPATKWIEKVAHPSNTKEYYNSYLKKNIKSVKLWNHQK